MHTRQPRATSKADERTVRQQQHRTISRARAGRLTQLVSSAGALPRVIPKLFPVDISGVSARLFFFSNVLDFEKKRAFKQRITKLLSVR